MTQPDTTDTKCVMCDNESKYTCPACKRKSCCVACVKSHKTQYDCDGTNPPIESIPRQDFNSNTLREDVKFLSKIGDEKHETESTLRTAIGTFKRRQRERRQALKKQETNTAQPTNETPTTETNQIQTQQ